MRGHVHKRGTTWTVVYDEGHDENGGRRQRSKGGFATRRDAQRFLTDVLSRLGDGSYAQPSKTTLAEFLIGEWLPAIEGTVRPSRTRSTPRLWGAHRPPHRPPAPASAHRRAPEHPLLELEQAGLSVATSRQAHGVLHSALKDALRWGRLVRNPAGMANPPRAERSRAQAWTAKELGRFLEHVRGDRLFPLWRLAATTGMRRGELLGLTWRCLDLDRARLVSSSNSSPPRRPHVRAAQVGTVAADDRARPGDGSRSRRAPGGAVARTCLRRARLRRRRPRLLRRARRLDPAATAHCVVRPATGRRPASPPGHLHTLRHTAATLALTEGVPVHIVAARLGDDPNTVLSTYAHLFPQSDELAAERVAALLAG